MKMKEEIEKTGLKLNIQKMKIMAFGPTTTWKIERETKETMTELDSILKSRDITNKALYKAVFFPVVMYGCESWIIKKLSAKELMLLNCGVGKDS